MRRDENYFTNLDTLTYASFMYEYQKCFAEFKFIMNKIECQQLGQKQISKRTNLLLRTKTVEIEKFGKKFRLLTIKMDKEKHDRSE